MIDINMLKNMIFVCGGGEHGTRPNAKYKNHRNGCQRAKYVQHYICVQLAYR